MFPLDSTLLISSDYIFSSFLSKILNDNFFSNGAGGGGGGGDILIMFFISILSVMSTSSQQLGCLRPFYMLYLKN